jgi:hypothetical protein
MGLFVAGREAAVGEFRVVMEVTTDDFEGLVELLEEASASLE